MDNNQKKELIILESRKEIADAVGEIRAHERNPIFGKFLKPIGNFINGFARRFFVLVEIQNQEILDLQKRLDAIQLQLENRQGVAHA
ncbi:hypothetical protein [Vibrio tritonius]|uniref:hypothetical protein n=1 Tax=Vibrio tritonius TaxID=1435069 RepID=UPI00315C61AD